MFVNKQEYNYTIANNVPIGKYNNSNCVFDLSIHIFFLVTNYCIMFKILHTIIIIKRGWQCKAGRERLTPYQSEDHNPTTPTHRKKEEKGKTVGDAYIAL